MRSEVNICKLVTEARFITNIAFVTMRVKGFDQVKQQFVYL